jgi:hypothetical protein
MESSDCEKYAPEIIYFHVVQLLVDPEVYPENSNSLNHLRQKSIFLVSLSFSRSLPLDFNVSYQ